MPSTVIASINYFPESGILRIEFVSGLVYDYKNVPEAIYTQLRTSRYKGIYFNRHIKGRYSFSLLK